MANKLSITRRNNQRYSAKESDIASNTLEMRLARIKARMDNSTKSDRTIKREDIEALYIFDKAKSLHPFRFWAHQLPILEKVNDKIIQNDKTRITYLKPRQCGSSTVFTLLTYYLVTRYNLSATILGHKDTSAQNLAAMIQVCYENDPFYSRGEIKATRWNDNVIQFPNGGKILVATAGAKAALTSTTNQILLLTETAYYTGDVSAQLKSVLNTCSNTHPFTFVFIESTAVPGTVFQERWDEAVAGLSSYDPMFTSWLDVEEYQLPFPDPAARTAFVETYNEDENKLSDQGASPEKLLWRRKQIADNCEGTTYESKKLNFMSEYPTTPDEAFASSDSAVFESGNLNTMKALSPTHQPVFVGDCAYYGINHSYDEIREKEEVRSSVFVKNGFGRLRIWEWPIAGVQYVGGADVSLGLPTGDNKTDDSTFVIRRQNDGEVVAVWRGKIPPDDFADYLTFIGLFYNTCYFCVENNNMGAATVLKMWKQYPKMAQYQSKFGVNEDEHERVGNFTNELTKARMITVLHAAIRFKHFTCYDSEVLNELLGIIRVNGKIHLTGKDLTVACMLSELARCDDVQYAVPPPKKELDDFMEWKAWKKSLERQAAMAEASDITGVLSGS